MIEDEATYRPRQLPFNEESGLVYTPGEARDRAVTSGRFFERMWEWLSAGDAPAAPTRRSQ